MHLQLDVKNEDLLMFRCWVAGGPGSRGEEGSDCALPQDVPEPAQVMPDNRLRSMSGVCQHELAKTTRPWWSAQAECQQIPYVSVSWQRPSVIVGLHKQGAESPIRSIISSFVLVLRSTPSFAEVLHCACRKRPFLIRPLENTLIKLLKSLDFYNDEGRIKIAIGAQHTFSPILCVEFLQLFASAGCLVSGHPQMCSPPCHILLLSMSFHCGAWSFSGVCFCLTNPLYTPVPKTAQSAPLHAYA